MKADDLKSIANSGAYGSGQEARDRFNAKADRRNHVPPRDHMNELVVANTIDALVCSFGNDSEDGKDYNINSDGYAAILDSSTAGEDARAIAALWNAYREGDLIWKDAPQ